MKRIVAVIRTELEQAVINALEHSPVVGDFTLKKVQHYGDIVPTTLHYRGRSVTRQWQEAYEVSLLVHDESCDAIVNLLLEKGRFGEQGDGFIVVQAVEQVIDVKTGTFEGIVVSE